MLEHEFVDGCPRSDWTDEPDVTGLKFVYHAFDLPLHRPESCDRQFKRPPFRRQSASGFECLTPGTIFFDSNQERRLPFEIYTFQVRTL